MPEHESDTLPVPPPSFLLVMFSTLLLGCAVQPERGELARDVQAVLDKAHKEFGFPGATAAFVLPDGTLRSFATGLADQESGAAMEPESRMLAASIGKTFVGATVIALAADGVVALNALISDWLGDRAWFSRLPNGPQIKVRHLLNHTAGLPDHVHDADFAEAVATRWREQEDPFTPEELVRFILDDGPLFAPGQGWAYTDTGYVLLGMIIEIATGRPTTRSSSSVS